MKPKTEATAEQSTATEATPSQDTAVAMPKPQKLPIATIEAKEDPPVALPKITISPKNTPEVSAFSLASIEKKKEWEKQQQPNRPEENNARDPFTQDDLEKHWQAYLAKKNKNKEQNIAALFQLSTPQKITDEQVEYQVPSNMNKVELEREFVYFLPFLRSALNNFGVLINVVVNETAEKQFIYTPEEKYHRLREINANLDTLRKELDLEL